MIWTANIPIAGQISSSLQSIFLIPLLSKLFRFFLTILFPLSFFRYPFSIIFFPLILFPLILFPLFFSILSHYSFPLFFSILFRLFFSTILFYPFPTILFSLFFFHLSFSDYPFPLSFPRYPFPIILFLYPFRSFSHFALLFCLSPASVASSKCR